MKRRLPIRSLRKSKGTPRGGGGAGKASLVKRGGKKQETKLDWDEEIESSEEGDFSENEEEGNDSEGSDHEELETAEQKRKRLAKEYLASMGDAEQLDSDNSDSDEDDADDDDEDLHNRIGSRLAKERLVSKGKFYRNLADTFAQSEYDSDSIRYLSGHQQSVTCVTITQDNKTVYSGSKDNAVIAWDVETGCKQIVQPFWQRSKENKSLQSQDGEVLAIAVSSDGRYVVSGGRDNEIKVFDVRNKHSLVASMKGHREAVTGLAFRKDAHSLYSCSLDRCLKHWEVSDAAYMETMFGHQDKVYSIDCWNKDKPVSSSMDRTIRCWNVSDDSHTVFRGHKGCIDTIQLLTDDSFVSAGEDGSVALWRESLKKPVVSVPNSHGFKETATGAPSTTPNWICSLATVKMSDAAFTGSSNGYINIWRAQADVKNLFNVGSIPVVGFVNSLAVSSIEPTILVAGLGREHKHGRWWNLKGNKDKVAIIRLPSAESL